MKKDSLLSEFATYEISLALKKLGFNEKCLGYYNEKGVLCQFPDINVFWNDNDNIHYNRSILNLFKNKFACNTMCIAPIWQQVIDWLREKCNYNIVILEVDRRYTDKTKPLWLYSIQGVHKNTSIILDNLKYDTYEEPREKAILKAIELIKNIEK